MLISWAKGVRPSVSMVYLQKFWKHFVHVEIFVVHVSIQGEADDAWAQKQSDVNWLLLFWCGSGNSHIFFFEGE